jgi:Ni,Fe-hydrogenase III small subunit
MFKINTVWLCVVAQTKAATKEEIYALLLKAYDTEHTHSHSTNLTKTLDNLVTAGHLVREKKGNGKSLFKYTDDCKLRVVTGNAFSKAVDCGVWSADDA